MKRQKIVLPSALVFWIFAATVMSADLSEKRHPIGGSSTRPKDITRRIQFWMIKQKAIPKTRSLRQTPRGAMVATTRGSLLTLQKPTKANICRWFGVDEDPGNLRCFLRRQFNHEWVGMTNPCIHVDSNDLSKNDLIRCAPSSDNAMQDDTATGTELKYETAIQSDWWPSLSFPPPRQQKWRVLIYRRRVGIGVECYQRVRDAALAWEFKANDEMGLALVPSPSMCFPKSNKMQPPSHGGQYTIAHVQVEEGLESKQIQMHQCIGAARRFVSYSAKRFAPFLPTLYSVNPVMVVYDVLDQRGPATTYSSTAYATMKGHLIRGEERVTVALRDGTDDVEVEILSVSRPGPSLQARAVWPFIGKMQNQFFELQLDSLHRIASHYR